jgi:restriction endonuclease S subunit
MGKDQKRTTTDGMVMTNDEYCLLMGKLVVNLQSLEFALRAFLYNKENSEKSTNPEFGKNIYDFKAGDCVEENAFTNYDPLGRLIDNYNGIVKSKNSTLCIDKNIVDIRDTIAHGRIACESPSSETPQKLIKYSKPQNGKVCVTHCITLTKDWFDKHIHLVYESIQRVRKANE